MEVIGLKFIFYGCCYIYVMIMFDVLIKVVGLKNGIVDGIVVDKYESVIGDLLLIF